MPDNDTLTSADLEAIAEAVRKGVDVSRMTLAECAATFETVCRRGRRRAQRRPLTDGLHVGRCVWLIVAGGRVVGGHWTTERPNVRPLEFYTTIRRASGHGR